MKLELPEVTSKYYAKQLIEAMLENDDLNVQITNPDKSSVHPWVTAYREDVVVDILFPEDSSNGA